MMTQTCKKCILNEHYEGITFNNEGICNYCTAYTSQARHNIYDDNILYSLLTHGNFQNNIF